MKSLIIMLTALFLVGCGSNETPNKTVQRPDGPVDQSPAIQKAFNYLEKGEVAQAIQTFDEVIKNHPRDPSNYIILGEVYLRLNNYLKAIDTLTAATRVDPQNGEAYYLLAIANGLVQRKDTAIEAAQKSSEIYLEKRDEEKLKRSLALLKSLQEADFQAPGTIPVVPKVMQQ